MGDGAVSNHPPSYLGRGKNAFYKTFIKNTPSAQGGRSGPIHTRDKDQRSGAPASLVLAPLHGPELGSLGYWRGKNPGTEPVLVSGRVSASVPRHQVPEILITKSTPTTGKRGPKSLGPQLCRGLLGRPQTGRRARNKGGPREKLVPRPRAQPSVEKKQPQPSRAILGTGGTSQPWKRLGSPKALSSGFRLPASDSAGAATATAFRT